MYLSTPHPNFKTRSNSTFNFLQVWQNPKTEFSSCSVIIQNFTHHSAVLSPGYIDYIEVPETNNNPPHYKINDVNSLIHTIIHTNYTDLSERKPSVHRSSFKRSSVELISLQPSQLIHRSLPSLAFSPDVQPSPKYFQYADVTDDEILKILLHFVKKLLSIL